MRISNIKYFTFLLFLMMLFLPIFSLSYIELFKDERNSSNNNMVSGLNINQVINFTISNDLHKFIWIEGYLNLNIDANESGLINCEFKDSENGKYFTQANRVINFTSSNQTQSYRLIFRPRFTTLPGRYNFTLHITGFYDYTENFELVLGMGYIVLILVILIFVIGLIFILFKKSEGEKLKKVSTPAIASIPSILIEEPSNKIQCPECKKFVDEGLAFCPECGSRIPEYLRFNPNSPRTP